MNKIFVLGSLNMDMSIHTNKIPHQGETAYGYGFLTNSGGKGANQAVSAAKQGAQTYLIGAVGKDMFGIELINTVKNYGVNTRHVHAVDEPTGCANIIMGDHDNRIILSAGANHQVQPRFIDSGLRDAEVGDIFITQFETNVTAISYAILKAKEKGMKIIVNAAPYISIPEGIMNNVDILIVNENECKNMFELDVITIDSIKSLFHGTLIVTVGKKGLFYVKDGKVAYHKAINVNVVDTTAAGDSLVGAFASQLDKGDDYAIKYALVTSALTCTRPGAQQSIPNKGEVEELMARLISNGEEL